MAWVPSVSRTSLNAQNTAESTSCALSTKIKPDSRGSSPAMTKSISVLHLSRQRPEAPGEQRPAAVFADRDHLLEPDALVLAARIEQMHRGHHALLQHPIAVGLAVGRGLLEIHVG